ncbi:hypothetical protein GcM3_007024 [Golovinomyces cichoracearum]|uniref:Uncharacterized protein n=1 Tax=Golovinomyces cichoracearum TaxID=62708 RepID=A0A420JAT5_9PEZI|nr:hypothetical protein GcM3_007024 [Golovinomyces cichoracearum]
MKSTIGRLNALEIVLRLVEAQNFKRTVQDLECAEMMRVNRIRRRLATNLSHE